MASLLQGVYLAITTPFHEEGVDCGLNLLKGYAGRYALDCGSTPSNAPWAMSTLLRVISLDFVRGYEAGPDDEGRGNHRHASPSDVGHRTGRS